MKIYLIGNGASMGYGTPCGAQFFGKAFDLFETRLRPPYNNDNAFYRLFTGLESLLRTAYQVEILPTRLHDELGVLKGLRSTTKRYAAIRDNLVHSLTAADLHVWNLLRQVNTRAKDCKQYGFRTLQQKQLNLVRGRCNAIDKIAWLTLLTTYLAIREVIRKPTTYNDFVRRKLNPMKEDVAIVNLNYDALLEEALKADFKGTVIHHFDSTPPFPRPFGSGVPTLHLFQPHGGFNILRCGRCCSTTIACGLDLTHVQEPGKRTCGNSCCGAANLGIYFVPYAEPDSVFTLDKTFLRCCLRHMELLLSRSRDITAIGYSFPPEDKHLNNLLAHANIEVVLESPHAATQKCCTLKHRGLSAFPTPVYGFEEYVNSP